MNKFTAFILVLLFAAVYVASFMPVIQQQRFAKVMNITGQIGLAAAILLFLVMPGKKKVQPESKGKGNL
jgi:hypothetical protein